MDKLKIDEFYARYPHIRQKVDALWGSIECADYLQSLLIDDRDGKRAGFSFEHARVLMDLTDQHKECFPQLEKSSMSTVFKMAPERPKRIDPKPAKSDAWKYTAVALIMGAVYYFGF